MIGPMLFPIDQRPAEMPRIVVTGAGIVTPMGIGWKANAEGFRTGRKCFGPVTLFDVSRQRVKTAAEVQLPRELPATALSRKQIPRLDRASRMLLWALQEAHGQAGWTAVGQSSLVLGTTSGGMILGEDYYRQAISMPGRRRQQPTRALFYLAHTQARLAAEAFGLAGSVRIIANACASGANAIGHGWELLRRGRCERALVAGYDALSRLVFAGFDALQTMSPTTCRPFDSRRDGLALGEGAAAFALETATAAERRGAAILGEIVGYGASIDLHHLTQPHPQGDAALEAMFKACEAGGVAPGEVDYVNAHGTGTPLNDHSEALAINRWAGERARTLPVSSTKAGIGHLLGGAGAVEAVVCLMALKEQWLPPQVGVEQVDPICHFPVVREPGRARLRLALSNSIGFGGANASLILRRWG